MISMFRTDRAMDRWAWFVMVAGIVGMAVWMFQGVLAHDVILFSTDNNIGGIDYVKEQLPGAYAGLWLNFPLLGGGDPVALNCTTALSWLLPLNTYMDWIHAVHLGLASVFLVCFLRLHRLSWLACAMAWLTAYWVGTNFTLVYAGHTGKFGVVMFATAALWCIRQLALSSSWAWSLLAGACLGGMLLEQQDVTVFVGLFVGAYAVFAVGRSVGWRVRPVLMRVVPIPAVALLLAGGTMLKAYAVNVAGVAVMEEDSGAKWEFCTQWSVPPDESIEFVAPGYMGWRSGEPEGPYWGRTGRSAGWEQTGQGFMNFRLEGIYVGAIPVALALFAVAAAVWGGRSDRRAEIFFWGGAAVLALLLAFGKFFPLYALLYKLPVLNNIRNPNKFLHVFQVALGILAAYGLDTAVRWRGETRHPQAL